MTVPGDEPADDRALLAAHVAGDPDAFGLLVRRHRDRLWAVALRTTGNPEDAADALQDALVSAYRRAGSFRGDAAVTTWLHRVVVNACLDRLRRAKVRLADPLPDDVEKYAARGALATSTARSPDVTDPAELTLDHEQRARVLAALATLPAEQRAAVVLVDMEGYSVEETAALLGCAPGTVKSRCSRARARLLPLLAGIRAPEPEGGGPGHRNRAESPRVGPDVSPERPGTRPTAGGDRRDA